VPASNLGASAKSYHASFGFDCSLSAADSIGSRAVNASNKLLDDAQGQTGNQIEDEDRDLVATVRAGG
jgi:hypothetical protein